MEQGHSKFNAGKILKVILIVVGILIICAAVFAFFKIRIDAKAALRDAKNTNMALRSADIEMYGQGRTIYDPTKKNGLADGAKTRAEQIFKPDGSYTVTSYDNSKHDLTGMTYRRGRYVVYYNKKGDKVRWDVDYIMRVYSFTDTETE